MKFHLTADATFEADDLDDAFWQLSQHFGELSEAFEEPALDFLGTITLQPSED